VLARPPFDAQAEKVNQRTTVLRKPTGGDTAHGYAPKADKFQEEKPFSKATERPGSCFSTKE
jgi:hypothetical protein